MKKIFNYFKSNRIQVLLILACFFLTIKYLLVDFGIDAAFQISMSYRFVSGDVMFREMWEPYQTSTFLCAILIRLYTGIFHTTTGIVLFLQFAGVLIDLGAAVFLYRTVMRYSIADRNTAFSMSLVFFLVSPKDVALPEYANMQVWFTLLLALFLFIYQNSRRRIFLVLAAVSLCMAVLAYPSCLLLFFAAAGFLLKNRDKKGTLQFSLVCVLIGTGFLVFLFIQGLSVNEIFSSFHYILGIETSHSMGMAEKLFWYLKVSSTIAVLFFAVYAFVSIIMFLAARSGKIDLPEKQKRALADILFLGVVLCISIYVTVRSARYTRYAYAIIFAAMIVAGFRSRKKLNEKQFAFYCICTVLSCMEFLGTLMLTNLGLISALPYLLIAAVASFVPISIMFGEDIDTLWMSRLKKGLVIASVLVLLGRNAMLIRPYNGDVSSIFMVRGIVKDGPAIGLITEYMGAYMQNETIKEWKEYVPEGSNIYIVGDTVDSIPYLYSDTGISAPSLVPTPGYNGMIAEYWEMNPDKYPDMVIVSCWYGELHISEDSWIMQWIDEEFQPSHYVEGKYYRYYYR